MKTVLFDTNFLLLPGMDGINVFSEIKKFVSGEYEMATLSSVVGELEKMKQLKSRKAGAASVALELIRKEDLKVIETGLKADDSILEFALSHRNTMVCTNDRQLKKKLKESDIQVIGPKGRKYLTLV